MLTCPHCHNNVPHGASVCRGCQAEVQYGAPLSWYVMAAFSGLLLGAWLEDLLPKNLTFLSGAVSLLAIVYGIIKIKKLTKDRIVFKRMYRTK